MNSQTPVDTLIFPQWIATVDGENRLLENHGIAIDNGCILAIEPAGQLHKRYHSDTILELPGHLVTPGFVNSHTHAAMNLFRGLADDLPLKTWLEEHIWPAEGQWIDEHFIHDGTQAAIAEMLKGGTTCFQDMYFFPGVIARTVAEAGIRACVSFPVLDFPTPMAQNADEYIHKGLQVRDDFRNHPRVHTAFGPHAPYTVSDAPLERIRMLAHEMDLPIHMHVHETRHEVEEACQQNGKRPLQRLSELGLLSPRFIAVHMTALNEDDIQKVAESGASIVHCPESNLKLASGFCPVQELLDAGINVALGTDGAASNNDLDMLGEMRTAALLAKGVSGNPEAVSADTVLRMATINGARALGLEEITGSIETGKAADLIAINLSDPQTQPVYNPVSQLVYAANSRQVRHVWVAGKPLLQDGELLTLNEESIAHRVSHWQEKIRNA